MKKNINNLSATSNGKFVEFYTWDDLTKSEQIYQQEFANYDYDDDTELICGKFIKTSHSIYYLGDFINKDDAVKARSAAEISFNFSGCKTTSLAYLYLEEKGLV